MDIENAKKAVESVIETIGSELVFNESSFEHFIKNLKDQECNRLTIDLLT